MLRTWQKQCIDLALDKYCDNKFHFLAQATPGAGKTFMAANLAKRMFDNPIIDFVICFSPSKSVSSSITECFSTVLGCPFDGKIGTLGSSITYQSLRYLGEHFWETLSKYRVLCIFDEIHHCAGDNENNTNSWGHHILCEVQKASTYTLALTGTPWRSDLTPVVLSSYSNPEGEIVCDYQYSLTQAVKDGVCRRPTIALMDCEQSTIETNNHIESFNSLYKLVTDGYVNYSTVLHNNSALIYILESAVSRLKLVRTESPSAGGLIVASSISHAKIISSLLATTFNQTTVTVTYKEDDPHSRIERFKSSNTEWIVSVGMVSEGTDIPRLQVCCHLSNIKTELYFRQILGRILRTTSSRNQEAWLYTFAAPKLIEFAEEIEQDIPNSCLFLKEEFDTLDTGLTSSDFGLAAPTAVQTKHQLSMSFRGHINSTPAFSRNNNTSTGEQLSLKEFNQRVIEAFHYDRQTNA
ncbi:diguanylate cyclase [Agarivorans sp. B2Z047]|uniref:DEAD/DEAH box helicase n=1 Tax=Agarivorans sp. B2Z047 TaxID=2652721 RepID=UPI00128D55B7|nr:DEAD/DEAH box helicase family protein [Agarivorans sp. B2Z047]MPW29674.1 diguanylate cyclase [Agarivorans sp. B2Z047]UQN40628.1 DEAD/DEAH box helicase family protein [Agarivorans sp. B2Z047]